MGGEVEGMLRVKGGIYDLRMYERKQCQEYVKNRDTKLLCTTVAAVRSTRPWKKSEGIGYDGG